MFARTSARWNLNLLEPAIRGTGVAAAFGVLCMLPFANALAMLTWYHSMSNRAVPVAAMLPVAHAEILRLGFKIDLIRVLVFLPFGCTVGAIASLLAGFSVALGVVIVIYAALALLPLRPTRTSYRLQLKQHGARGSIIRAVILFTVLFLILMQGLILAIGAVCAAVILTGGASMVIRRRRNQAVGGCSKKGENLA